MQIGKLVQEGAISIKTGPFGTQLKASEYQKSGTPVLNVKNLGFGSVSSAKLDHVGPDTVRRLQIHLLQQGDIVIGRKGAVDRHAYIDIESAGWMQGSDCIRLRVETDAINPRFLSYYFLTNKHKLFMASMCSHGTTMASLNQKILEQIDFPYLERLDQDKIVRILETLDEKIRVNQKINENLDEQISSLYNYYFENLPYSELEETRLQDFVFFQEGPGIRNWQYVTENGIKFINIRCISGGDLNLSTANMISSEEANGKYAHFMLKPYDIIMSCSGTLGRYAIVREEHLPLCLNTSVIRFRPAIDFEDYSYVYGYMTSKEFLQQQEQMANGSAQVNFGPTHLKKIVMHIPSKELRMKFHENTFPLINLKLNNLRENYKLVATRDTLLTRLMSGELDVSNIDI